MNTTANGLKERHLATHNYSRHSSELHRILLETMATRCHEARVSEPSSFKPQCESESAMLTTAALLS
ncbi:uncharacterized protein LACBIDRAFT_297248 [Laccaria bicolor S238N-H82]|uniref:Predicted protein n=1 Tax=Laccaria bicolor (strain S238N-H82 / ATCC MYA-4686) TaxID=486041 RepID=B0DAC7_LACBS|nr:uncharacterized protein LACBIDRAFT_297248 [Laccaria bicolor S238N-H82]EDR08728.1 predicted protein [Laccaria bicolor S238N-H82]|eukprot:XP_001880953.1 predicted protein [Laccaria bicolor S238N-H82]